jgi:hypothetical protein
VIVVGERAGYRGDVERDEINQVRGEFWDTVAYQLRRQMAVA